MKNKMHGLTLIELLVVLVILGMLAGILVPKVIRYLNSGQHRGAVLQHKRIMTEIDRFYLDAGRFPATLGELSERPQDVAFWSGPYLEATEQKDPWGHAFHYRFPGEHRDYDLWSLGKDNQLGGQDENADVRNWTAD